jgi:hypothetical protein
VLAEELAGEDRARDEVCAGVRTMGFHLLIKRRAVTAGGLR